jgi:hypothetical protein
MRRRLLAALAAAAVAVAGAALYYARRPARGDVQGQTDGTAGQTETASGVIIIDATPLPATYEKPGLVSQRFGVMRIYVSAAPEVSLKGATQGSTLDVVPILVVLENDSYREADARRDLGLDGAELFSVEIRDPSGAVVFSDSTPAEESVWGPAERKTFNLNWHPTSLAPGQYVISLKPAFGDAGEVQLPMRLK